jgi:hypothetical protein
MSKTVISFGVIVFLIISWLIGFVDKLDEEVDVNYGFNEKAMVEGNYKLDSIGNEVLELSTLSLAEKKRLWNQSQLKEEMINLFPNFSEIKYFIENRLEDDGSFKHELLTYVEHVQDNYIGGGMSGKKAKIMLSNF